MATPAAAIQRTLNLIIPTSSTLPPTLIDLSTNLLAQSRAKAPSLKPDEEIARTFACCHIACERLKNRLALEIGKVGPPCGPRIYKRLYAFLDSALPAAPSTPRTNRAKDVAATPASGRSGRKGAELEVPGSRATPTSGRRRTPVARQRGGADLPSFTMPLIRHICDAMETKRAATHVYAGVESAYRSLKSTQEETASVPDTPSKRRKANNGQSSSTAHEGLKFPTEEQVPALVVAVWSAAMQPFLGRSDPAFEALRTSLHTTLEAWYAKQKSWPTEFDPESLDEQVRAYLQAAEPTWRQMEWYKNVPKPTPDVDTLGQSNLDGNPSATPKRPAKTPLRRKEKHAQRPVDENDLGPAGLLPGLGTMFQPAVDWLSEDRQADFIAWKEDLLYSMDTSAQKG